MHLLSFHKILTAIKRLKLKKKCTLWHSWTSWNAKPAHSDTIDIPSLDDLQILFLENGDSSDYLISYQKKKEKGKDLLWFNRIKYMALAICK